MRDRRRLLLITERFEPDLGGVARSATRTAKALAGLGLAVEVLSWTRSLSAGQRETIELPIPEPASTPVIVHRLGLFANLDYSLQHTIGFLEARHAREPFDGIWGHYLSPAGFLAVLFGRSVGIPASVSARGNDVDMIMFPPGDFARLSWTLERAKAVTAVSRDLARKIQLLTSPDRQVRVVPNSVDLEVYCASPVDDELKASLGIAPDETVLGFSGELRHKKGLLPLLSAFCQVHDQRPACLLIIGQIRIRDESPIATFAAENPAARNRLIVTGHLDDPLLIARHLQLCDMFLQPSHWDGMPNSVLEAMACERLVLASDAGGIPEVIEHGKSGFLLPRGELFRLGDAVLELLTLSDNQRRSIGQAARRRIEDSFSPRDEAASLEEAMRDLWQA